jgi:hypothetical protein
VLKRRFYEIFGAYAVAQSLSEHDVKVGKWILGESYERLESIITRFRMFVREVNWDQKILETFPDADPVLRELRTLIRAEPHTEKAKRHEEQSVAPGLAATLDRADLDAISQNACLAI